MKDTPLDSRVRLSRALGHPARLRIVAMLRAGELCVCQITEVLQLAPSTVSAHLKELSRAGLIEDRKDGRWVWIGLSQVPAAENCREAMLKDLNGDPQLAADQERVIELRNIAVSDLCRLGYEEAKARANKPH